MAKRSQTISPAMFGEKAATMGLTGAALGALTGLATSDKGNRNKAVGRGAVMGAGTELGGLAGAVPGALLGGVGGYMLNGMAGAGLGAAAGGGVGAAGGALLGNMAGRGMVGPYKRDPVPSKPKKESPKKDTDTDTETKEDEKMANAFKFGVKLAMDPRLMGGLGGAALGAGVGGLAGLVNPGVDESGKRKSRVGSALMGALGGAGVGGLGGAAVGHFAPNQTQQFGSQIAGLLGGGKAAPSAAEQAHNRQMKALNQGFTRGWPNSETDQPRHELVKAVGEEPLVSIEPDYNGGGVSRRRGTDLSVSQSIPGNDRQNAAILASEDRMRAAEGRPSLQQEMQMLRAQAAQQKQLQGAYGAEPMGPQ